MIHFSLFGIPVKVQPFFWISLLILGGQFGSDTFTEIFQIFLFVIAGFISILVHELGHALTARHFGADTAITLQAFGGYAAYRGARMSRFRSFLITAAGPAIQLILGLAVLAIYWNLPELNGNSGHFLSVLAGISLVWAVINLLPVLPLDGGQMLKAVLGPARIKITLWISIIVAIAAALGLLWWDRSDFIFSMFLGMFAWQSVQKLQEIR